MIRAARPAIAGLAALAGLAILAGCAAPSGTSDSGSPEPTGDRTPLTELELYPDPKAAEGPSTAVVAADAIEPIATDPAQTLPATIVSHDPDGEREVQVTDTSRIIALDIAGSLAATVWGLGLGDSLVGRDMSTQFPGVEDLPIVTSGAHSVSAESVLALRPTLIITDGTVGPRDVLEQLRSSGVTVVFLDNEASFEGASTLARDVGAALGVPEAGAALGDRIAAEVADTVAQITEIAPTDPADKLRVMFLYLRGSSGIYYLFGQESGADHLIEALGARDVASELGWEGSRPMTDEAMIEADPDLILVMTDGLSSAGGVDGLLAAKPAIALTTAGQHRRFVDMADAEILSFGPRSALVLDALARAVYAKP
ncbi:hemin ABC transporter substrate-binding protein [Homoserinibacter sp. GY 40078]|uniref:heme/hemin ABC transporter substrate-binding protein n=1 Tax=Homoserinibacter sp. GY 40078 TaxID=2603275 RepID=UPI0011C7C3BC|nr:ABC transporter substrate-binding protein [Homoserinibacter sp. GY 40078]TXK19015.1 ABC transporter substrate-binding protein [Homoserinibacter sp. GY 40078]